MLNKNQISSLRELFEQSQQAICCLETNGGMSYANPAMMDLLKKLNGSAAHETFIAQLPFFKGNWIENNIASNTLCHSIDQQCGNGDVVTVNVTIENKESPYLFVTLQPKNIDGQNMAGYNLLFELINNIPDNIFAKDTNHCFIMANQWTAKHMGVPSTDYLIGKTDFDFYPHAMASLFAEDEKHIMESGVPITGKEEEVLSADGKARWYSTTKVPLHDAQGKIIGILGIGRDITTQKLEKDTLKEAKRQAEIADQLKSAFLANMSHELRTPLNGILGFAQFLRGDNVSLEKRSKYVDIIFYNGKHLLSVINNVIDVAKIDAGEIFINKQNFGLNGLMQRLHKDFLEMLENKNKKEVALKIELSLKDEDSIVFTDQSRLVQIMENILNNAVKFTNCGEIKFGYKPYREGEIIFFVTDTGVGIPVEKQKIIFNKFRQADDSLTRRYGGSGLGLAISKGLVELLGGEIWFESIYHQGSSFYFTLPVVNKDIKQEEEILKLDKKWNNKSILIVEDDDMSYRFLELLFKNQYVKIERARDGIAALNRFNEVPFQLVLMDIRMPEMDGLEVTQRIRQKNQKIPIIALTAYAYDNDKKKAIEAGCNNYLAKPIDKEKMFNLLNQLSFD